MFRWTWGDEGEDGGEGGSVVRHARVPVVQDIRTRQRAVEFFCAPTRAFAIGSPFFQVPVGAKTIGGAREEEYE